MALIIPGELYAVLLNLLSNALKSVIAQGEEKIIEFKAKKENRYISVELLDIGIGLDEKYFEDVFVTFTADPGNILYNKIEQKLNPEERIIFGEGSGLGLSTVRDIIQSRRGRIQFFHPEGGYKARVQFQLPYSKRPPPPLVVVVVY